jgi:hypothetical protein
VMSERRTPHYLTVTPTPVVPGAAKREIFKQRGCFPCLVGLACYQLGRATCRRKPEQTPIGLDFNMEASSTCILLESVMGNWQFCGGARSPTQTQPPTRSRHDPPPDVASRSPCQFTRHLLSELSSLARSGAGQQRGYGRVHLHLATGEGRCVVLCGRV